MNLLASAWFYREQEVRIFLAVLFLGEVDEPSTEGFHSRADVLSRSVLRANSSRNAIIPVKIRDLKNDLSGARLDHREAPVVKGAHDHSFHYWRLACRKFEVNRIIDGHFCTIYSLFLFRREWRK